MNRILSLTKRYCKELGVRPSKRLGQTFLVDEALLRRIVDYAEIGPRDDVLEVGPGFGFLTQLIAERARRVVCVEKDRRMAEFLRKRVEPLGNVVVVEGDFLRIDPPRVSKVVSNPPYSIASPLLFKILDMEVELAVLTLQKEFAQRMTAQPGTREYGRLTVSVSLRANVERLEYVPSSKFFPKPKVDSVVVRIIPKQHPPEASHPRFGQIVAALFSQRRRSLRKALRHLLDISGSTGEVVLDRMPRSLLEKRVYQLEPIEFLEIYRILYEEGVFGDKI